MKLMILLCPPHCILPPRVRNARPYAFCRWVQLFLVNEAIVSVQIVNKINETTPGAQVPIKVSLLL